MKLQLYFDYACPFCLRGYVDMMEVLKEYPQVEVEWWPCEAHPRPDRYGLHSDLCARGMYIACDLGADVEQYHMRMFRAAIDEQKNIEDVQTVCDIVESLVDAEAFRAALRQGIYQDKLDEANRMAWEKFAFAAVPSLVADAGQLRSLENVGLTKPMIADFLKQINAN